MSYLKTAAVDVCVTRIWFWEMVKGSASVNFGVRMHVVFTKSFIKFSKHLQCKPCANFCKYAVSLRDLKLVQFMNNIKGKKK